MTRRRAAPDSPETRALKRKAALDAAEDRRRRTRWYIQLNVKPPRPYTNRWGGVSYHKFVWPKLFLSYEAAQAHVEATCPQVWSCPQELGASKINSCSIEKTLLPKDETI